MGGPVAGWSERWPLRLLPVYMTTTEPGGDFVSIREEKKDKKEEEGWGKGGNGRRWWNRGKGEQEEVALPRISIYSFPSDLDFPRLILTLFFYLFFYLF